MTTLAERPPAESPTPQDAPDPAKMHVTYLPAIDGLRAVAVVAVMVFHANLLTGGYLGVDLFFTLSGFLITRLLLTERDTTGRTRLGKFWLRRMRRLLPTLFVVLAATIALVWRFGEVEDALRLRREVWGAVTYSNNWLTILKGADYWDAGGRIDALGHLWSLAIEEQFYLLFPFVFVLFARNRLRLRRRLVLGCGFAGLTSMLLASLMMRWGADVNTVYLGTFTRFGAILAGCVLAAARPLVGDGADSDALARGRELSQRTRLVIGVGSLAVMAVLWAVLPFTSELLYRGGLTLQAATAVGLLVAVTPAAVGPFRVLAWGPLVWIGKRSYAIYLVHLPAYWYLSRWWPARGDTRWQLLLIGSAVTLVISALIHVLVENPLRFMKWRPLTALPAYASAVAVLLVVGSIPARRVEADQSGNTDVARRVAAEANTRAADSLGRKPVVLVVGDSSAEDSYNGLADFQAKRIDAVGEFIPGCPLVRSEPDGKESEDDAAFRKRCEDWKGRYSDAVDQFRPDIAIFGGYYDSNDHRIDGKTVGPCSATFRKAHLEALNQMADLFTQRGVLLMMIELGDPDRDSGHPSGVGCLNDNFAKVAKERHLPMVDVATALCEKFTCPFDSRNNRFYRDAFHFNDDGRKWESGVIAKAVLGPGMTQVAATRAATTTSSSTTTTTPPPTVAPS